MMNDPLRDQIRDLDPMHPGVPTESVTTPSSRQRLEHIMSTTETRTTESRTTGRWYAMAAAAAVVVVALIGVLTLTGNGDDAPEAVAGPPLELSLGEGDALASCLPFSVEILAGMPLAFEGTATAVEGEMITLAVDRWFTGGDAAQVTLIGPAGMEALIGGIEFTVGGQYLITATNGTVNYCGYSAPATPELRAAFEEAFGA